MTADLETDDFRGKDPDIDFFFAGMSGRDVLTIIRL